jgi:hypothetical protein
MTSQEIHHYHPTESKYKGGAQEMYVTYDIEQHTRGHGTAVYPKAKRVYISGDVRGWRTGDFTKKSGRRARGVQVEYEQSRRGYQRRGFHAHRGSTSYEVRPASVKPVRQRFTQVVEVPTGARNIEFHQDRLPERYRSALQDVR